VNRAYHKIWRWVKRKAPTAICWGRGEAYRTVEGTRCKLPYRFCRTSRYKDKGKQGIQDDTEVLRKVLLKLRGKRFRLDCSHHITFGHFLGDEIIIMNGKSSKPSAPGARISRRQPGSWRNSKDGTAVMTDLRCCRPSGPGCQVSE